MSAEVWIGIVWLFILIVGILLMSFGLDPEDAYIWPITLPLICCLYMGIFIKKIVTKKCKEPQYQNNILKAVDTGVWINYLNKPKGND